jgi:hypothetical protein
LKTLAGRVPRLLLLLTAILGIAASIVLQQPTSTACFAQPRPRFTIPLLSNSIEAAKLADPNGTVETIWGDGIGWDCVAVRSSATAICGHKRRREAGAGGFVPSRHLHTLNTAMLHAGKLALDK